MIMFRLGLLLTLHAARIVIGEVAGDSPLATPPDDTAEPAGRAGSPPQPPPRLESDDALRSPAPGGREEGRATAGRRGGMVQHAEKEDGHHGDSPPESRRLSARLWWRRWPPWGAAREETSYGEELVLSGITEDTPETPFTLMLHQWGAAGDTDGYSGGGGGGGGSTKSTERGDPADGYEWKGAGGEFGLSADWREALSMPDGDGGGDHGLGADGGSLRGAACMTDEKRAEVGRILEKRGRTAATNKVAICVRTKDFARFLPEWIAFHYALGVDEIGVYDDDSVDNTKEVLQPFVDAGIVKYVFEKIKGRGTQMIPLNHCLFDHHKRLQNRGRSGGDGDGSGGSSSTNSTSVARWVLFHDTDEYLFPMDTTLTIPEALRKHEQSCCTMIPRVQYGSGRNDQMPRGLMLEAFRTHNRPGKGYRKGNGNAKVTINFRPTEPHLGLFNPPLRSMHNAQGCTCDGDRDGGVPDLRINHYLGSIGDYMDRTARYWKEKRKGNLAAANTVLHRDLNEYRSDAIVHWACATREVLFRVANGLDLE
ncbi:unnamed protein product [Scytosiphon promiscuus]